MKLCSQTRSSRHSFVLYNPSAQGRWYIHYFCRFCFKNCRIRRSKLRFS